MLKRKQCIYIVEDMAITRSAIASVLEQHDYTICGSAVTAERAWIEIQERTVDLVLLDLNLKGSKNGLWLARKIRESMNCALVFLTAYGSDRILSQIHETEPEGYIMKPFNNPTLVSAVKVALRNFKREDVPHEEPDPSIQSAFIKCNRGLVRIDSDGILYIKSEGNYSTIFLENNIQYVTRDKLDAVMERLSFSNLFRVHRRYVVNAEKVSAIKKDIVALNEIQIPVSKTFQADLLRKQLLK